MTSRLRLIGMATACGAMLATTNAVGQARGGAASLAPPVSAAAGGKLAGVAAHPDPLSLLADEDAALAANKRLAFDMWRSVVNAGHVELADDMLRQDYIQHSPVLPTGRAAFKTIFSAVKRREIPDVVSPPLVTLLAEGDLVVMALREALPEPSGKGSYTTTHFNLFRVAGNRLAEHWHSVQDAPGPNVLPPDRGGPQRITGAQGQAQLALLKSGSSAQATNKRLVFDAWRSMRSANRAKAIQRYYAPDYVEHDPNLGPDRRSLAAQPASRPAAALSAAIDEPVVAIVAQGDLVVVVTARVHQHPSRPSETYTTAWFDMFRISKGRIAEHWTGASKPGTPKIEYGG